MVTKKEILESLNKNQQNQLENIEKIIDKEIINNYDGEPLEIDFKNLPKKIIEEIINKYSDAGWSIQDCYGTKTVSSQRDGDYEEERSYFKIS